MLFLSGFYEVPEEGEEVAALIVNSEYQRHKNISLLNSTVLGKILDPIPEKFHSIKKRKSGNLAKSNDCSSVNQEFTDEPLKRN